MKLLLILLAVCLYFILIKPRRQRKPRLNPFKGQYYAHRGLHNKHQHIPENSLAAFRHAVNHGYGIELDIQLSKDDQVVVFHDNTLSRVCGIDTKVRENTWDDLRRMKLLDTRERIPLLKDVLELVDGQVPLLIEIKLPGLSPHTCQLLDKVLRGYSGTYCIQSFNPIALYWYRRHRPDITRGQLSSNLTKGFLTLDSIPGFFVKYLLTNIYSKPDFISYCHRDSGNISFLLDRYLYRTAAMAWTLHSENDILNCEYKFDSFIFEGFFPIIKAR